MFTETRLVKKSFNFTYLVVFLLISIGVYLTWFQNYNPTKKTVIIYVTKNMYYDPKTYDVPSKYPIIQTDKRYQYFTSQQLAQYLIINNYYEVDILNGEILTARRTHKF